MKTAYLSAILLILFLARGGATTLLDQSQTEYDGGLSARTLPGYEVGQSFTAGLTGTLSEIDMGFFNTMSGSGQLQILSETGNTGQVLETETVTVTATNGGISWNDWSVDVPVVAGNQYTFLFTPNAATLPDPYGVCLGNLDTYSGGNQYLVDPGGISVNTFQSVFRTYVTVATVATVPPVPPTGPSSMPMLQYTFNETGTTAASTGWNPAPLQFLDASGSAVDLHSADALGVSGMPGDRAFDNTASTGMGDGYTGGVGEVPAGTIGTLESFTFQCWFNVATPIGNRARLLEDTRLNLTANGGQLSLEVNGTSVSSEASYGQTGQWVFFAVTYDGSKTSNNVTFYIGTKTSPVVQVELPQSLNGGSVVQDQILAIGNYNNGNIRPLDGYMDDVRLFGSPTDGSGVQTPAQLEALRQQDVVNGQDALQAGQIDITGNILQQSGTSDASTITSLTIPTLLKLLHVSNPPPANTLRYYYDVSTQSYVIAPRIDALTGLGFPVATLLSLGGPSVSWNNAKNSSVAAYSVTGMNGNLSGTARSHTEAGRIDDIATINSTLFGTISGTQSIMDISVRDVFIKP